MSKDTKKVISLVAAAFIFFALFSLPVVSKFANKEIIPVKLAKDPDDKKLKPPAPDKDLRKLGAIPKSILVEPKKKHLSEQSLQQHISILNIVGSICSVVSFMSALVIWVKSRKKEEQNG